VSAWGLFSTVKAANPQVERQQVLRALRDARLVRPQPTALPVKAVSRAGLAATSESLAQARPVSQRIVDERNGP
jgi:hypothetical protein